MRIFRNIVIVLLLVGFFLVSIIGLMIEAPSVLGFTPDRLHAWGRSAIVIMRPGLGLFWFWLVVSLSTILVFLITVARPRRQMKIEVQMGGGKVVILDGAIKKYIRKALAEIGEVTVRRIDLHDTRSGIMTNVYADVRTRENLPLIQRRMITRIRTALTEELGITNLADVHVFIRDFEMTGRPAKSGRAAKSVAAASTTALPTTESTSTAAETGAEGESLPGQPGETELPDKPAGKWTGEPGSVSEEEADGQSGALSGNGDLSAGDGDHSFELNRVSSLQPVPEIKGEPGGSGNMADADASLSLSGPEDILSGEQILDSQAPVESPDDPDSPDSDEVDGEPRPGL